MTFPQTIEKASLVLAEGAVIERLRRNEKVVLDPYVEHAGFIYDSCGRAALETIFREYIDIGQAHNLPMIVLTTTWRANPERIQKAGLTDCADIQRDSFRFLDAVRQSYGTYARQVYIGGLIGCAGDAYDPTEALSVKRAAVFHWDQVRALCDAGVDFLLASTLPAYSEAHGMALAMASCDTPYMLSFVLQSTGMLLDDTPLHKAVSRIDSDADPRPLGYMVNCVHPSVFVEALRGAARIATNDNVGAALRGRVLGLQANTSRLAPEELDGLDHVHESDDPSSFADAMFRAWRETGIRILGGCCGTDGRHIRGIAERAGKSR